MVSQAQAKKALAKHEEQEMAKRGERLVVIGYPYSHNPYIPHLPVEDCFKGCVLMKDWKGLDGLIHVDDDAAKDDAAKGAQP